VSILLHERHEHRHRTYRSTTNTFTCTMSTTNTATMAKRHPASPIRHPHHHEPLVHATPMSAMCITVIHTTRDPRPLDPRWDPGRRRAEPELAAPQQHEQGNAEHDEDHHRDCDRPRTAIGDSRARW